MPTFPGFACLPAACLLLLSALPVAGAAQEADDATARAGAPEWLHELDPYYSSIALQLSLTGEAVPDGGSLPEREVYRRLFRDSLRPRVLVLEASVYPLPVAGTWLKEHHPDVYDDFDIGTLGSNQLNVLDGITAGFQEPWAVSAFVGSAMNFARPGEEGDAGNRGYMGYLVSAGAEHIRNNVLIDDDWWEFEWKLKGEREAGDESLSWSFRLGTRTHGNPDIRDVWYVGLRRSNLDYGGPLLHVLKNSSMEWMTEFDTDGSRFLRQELTFGKKLPLRRFHIAPSLDLGFVYEDDAKYTGALADPSADTFTVVFRPNFAF